MSVHLVDRRTQRHKLNAKKLFHELCVMLDRLNNEVAGYALVVWADDGTAAMSYLTGGPVEAGGVAIYAHQKLNKLVEKTLQTESTYS